MVHPPVAGAAVTLPREPNAVESFIVRQRLPLLTCHGAHGFTHDVQLIHVGLTREQRLPVGELAHDASDRPRVHLGSVFLRSQQQLGRSVPPRGYVICENFVGLVSLELACKAKIAEFERVRARIVRADEQVLRFDVPVHDVVSVAPRDCLDELPDVPAHERWVEAARALLEHLQQVTGHVFEHQVQFTLATESLLRCVGNAAVRTAGSGRVGLHVVGTRGKQRRSTREWVMVTRDAP